MGERITWSVVIPAYNEASRLPSYLRRVVAFLEGRGEAYEVVSEPGDLIGVRGSLQQAGIEYESAESSFLPSVQVPLDEDAARKVFKLIDALEDCDDVQNVFANFDVSDEVMAEVDA